MFFIAIFKKSYLCFSIFDYLCNMISVCMATYNGERYIKEQVSSILQQLGEDDELVVSDDGSTDSTLQVLASFHDSRIKVFSGPCIGLTYNFENAIKNASGDYLFLSDQDDVWEPSKVERMVAALQDVDLVISDAWICDENVVSTGKSLYDICKPHKGFWPTLYHTTYIGCCTAFRRTILKKLLPFPPHIVMHDYWIGQIADLYYKTTFIPDKLLRYRRHGNNTSALTTGISPLSLYEKLSYRYWIFYYVLRRWIQ